ncbi:MAG: lysine--tRNA ligase, partial [Nitrospinae bacterium]|nr:lysine--tRNA ligase [Nitrospinota bacterium]
MEETGHLIKQRLEKVDELRARGIRPFNNKFKVNAVIDSLVSDYSHYSKEELAEKDVECVVAGRIMTRRKHGKTTFIHIKDRTGQ